ncbi:histone deacetylase hosB [Aspergillus vadensis CBS 113365]|uniref:Histone deacetylase HosB n=1 Tax=Aspergillus vadensis (strain CBS 113365 / IMI 142717 / IBT 24658) TaxID=1448311 RepID=A0A319BL16_ASPVC|nr:histone deacetylase HosB [Aspergillus vadensis CBS 113365]PYH72579.1 histone deacetylase HosB [Aspergillus vadensis CBS 113365]
MDPSKRHEPTSFTAASSPPATEPPLSTDDVTASTQRLSYPSLHAMSLPPSSPGLSSAALLSPSDPPARAVVTQAHPTPRRIPSSSSLADERRKSSPSLKKRSSTASLRSNRGASTSPRPSLSRHSSSSFGTSPTSASAPHPNMAKKAHRTASAEHSVAAAAAASIAAESFRKEVAWHQSAKPQSQTLVLVHDACYGHRFSRPRTSRAALNSIVERPERIQASVLGISAAYVRLARRHAGGTFAPHPDLNPQQLPVPPFQIRKTARTLSLSSPAVTHVHGSKWMEDLKTMCDAAESRLALNGKELVRPRSAGKDSAATNAPAFHEGDLYLCSESLSAFEGALGGVSDGVDAVMGPGPTKRAFVCIRPPGHHCSAGHPSGFCWINNVHVGISYAAMTHGLTHAAILDFDLHHGDGSQDIAWQQNHKAVTAPRNAAPHRKTMVGYFSLHDINSYPCEMGEPEKVRNASVCIDKAHGQSIWNVHLEPWKSDKEFWDLYAAKYTVLIDKARAFLRMHTERLANTPNGPPPKAAIFISAGFDASEWEGAGMQRHQVNVPTEFYARFTADVVRMANEEGLGTDGRIISVLEGGYSNRALTSGVLSHLSGLGDAKGSAHDLDERQIDRLASEMTDRLGLSDSAEGRSVTEPMYNSEWWSPGVLEELEALVYSPAAPVKPREKAVPTYLTTTQSFSAKVVNPPRDRRSTGSHSSPEPEVPSPPPPVGWATATHELCKVLVPTGRQTTSCRPEELNAEASRLRRERQTAADAASTSATTAAVAAAAAAAATTTATATASTAEDSRMKLRVRKPKPSLPASPPTETVKRPAARGSRRTTIDAAPDIASAVQTPGRVARRKSAGAGSAVSTPEPTGPRPASSAAVRKTSTSQSSTPRLSSSPNTPPVPRVPPAFLSAESEGSPNPDGTQDDLDSLTAGVRKLHIKLKVPSPEENAARERERERRAAEERKRAASKASSKTQTQTQTPKSPRKPAGRALSSASKAARSAAKPAPVAVQPETEVKDEPSIVTPVTSSPPSVSKVESSTTNGWDRSEPEAAASMVMSPPLTPGRPPSALYSPPGMTLARDGLPVMMSSGVIPFAEAVRRDEQGEEGKGGNT